MIGGGGLAGTTTARSATVGGVRRCSALGVSRRSTVSQVSRTEVVTERVSDPL